MTLEEYAQQNPMEEAPEDAARRRQDESARGKAQEARRRVDRLKEAITAGMEQGTAPQYLLYGAVDAIAVLDDDAEWAEPIKERLDAIYKDLAQESLLVDNAAIAAARLEEQQREHNEKLRKELNRRLLKQVAIEAAIRQALRALDELEAGEQTFL